MKGSNKASRERIAENKAMYEKIHKALEAWPDWKKKVYNEQFAVSKLSTKLEIGNDKK